MQNRTIAVIGTGVMGRGIMQWAATAGMTVIAYDERAGAVDEAVQFVSDMLQRAVAKGKMASEDLATVVKRIREPMP